MKEKSPEVQKAVLLARIDHLPESPEVEFAAERLDRWHWQPQLLADVPDFSRITVDRLRREVLRFFAMDDRQIVNETGVVAMDPELIRITQASMLVNAAELVWRLRADDPEAWDSIAELYDDD